MTGLTALRRVATGRMLLAWCGVGGDAGDEADGAGAGRTCGMIARVVHVQVLVPAYMPKRVPVVMRYDIADPYAVCAELPGAPGRGVSWVFARDLMSQGLTAPTGDGDVRIWPAGSGRADVRIAFRSPDGEALLQAAIRDVVDFLRRSHSLCPPGREGDYLEVDATLRRLLPS